MNKCAISPISSFTKEISIPGDKSISHRSAIFLSVSRGKATIKNYLCSEDCLSTLAALKAMGIEIEQEGTEVTIFGGAGKLSKPLSDLNLNNSGTGFRLLCGLLAACDFETVLTGDESLCSRPMKRIVDPLTLMGAFLRGRGEKQLPPLKVRGGNLSGITYQSPVASAQVKSAILIASLFAKGKTIFTEPAKSRDHSERMLAYLGCDFNVDGLTIEINCGQTLEAKDIIVPGDISSAAFFIALGLLKENSVLTIKNVGLNPSRIGVLEVFKRMGANIEIRENHNPACFEPVGDLIIRSSSLQGIKIEGDIIPNVIDEIPIIALVAAFADGETVIADAKELRVKESDRIKTVVENFQKIGVGIEEKEEGFIVQGNSRIHKAVVNSYGDHRIAMTMAIAGLLSSDGMIVENTDCVGTSFPGFFDILAQFK